MAAEVFVLVLKASLFLTVLAVGLRAGAAELSSVLRAPTLLLRSLIATTVLMPIVAVLLSRLLDLPFVVRLALGALSLSPVPPTWSGKPLKSGGERSYVIGLLVAGATMSVLTVPLGIEVFQRVSGIPMEMSAATVARLAVTTLLLPLFAGAGIRTLSPGLADRVARPVAVGAQIILLVGVVPIIVRAWPLMVSLVGNGTLLAMVLFVLAGLGVGHAMAGDPIERRSVLATATAFRHPTIAIAIAHAAAPEERLAPAAIVMYLLVCVVVTAPYQMWVRRRIQYTHPIAH